MTIDATGLTEPADETVTAALRAALGARILLPGEPGYEAARPAWNRAVDQRPFAIACPESIDEVADTVRAAAACGLRVAPQSTGHAAAALAGDDLRQAVLVSMSRLRSVHVDARARTARVAGGALWNDVLAASTPFGLTAVHGSAGDISVVGYTLSGGLSFYGRRHGLAVNTVRSVRIVTASGETVFADASTDPELFWAVRGGSGGLGVVVEITIDLLPYADVWAGMLLWDASRAGEVGRAWAQWSAGAPESATTALRVMHFPPLPELPAFLSGRSVVAVDGVVLDTDAAAAALLQPLRDLAPEVDTFGRIPAADLVHVHMDPPEPTPATTAHAMLHALPRSAVDVFVAAALGERPMISEIRHVGAAIARPAAAGGALSSVAGGYALSAVEIVAGPQAAAEAGRCTRAVVTALADWHAPELEPTFVDEPGVAPERLFGAALPRLAAAKRTYDPSGMFLAAQRIL